LKNQESWTFPQNSFPVS